MIRKAFITGATGFLGYNIASKLLAQNWEIFALHRSSSDIEKLQNLGVNMIQGDVLNYDILIKNMPDRLNAVFHVAADTSVWSRHNIRQTEINVTGTQNMVKAALTKKASRFIHTSSIAAYGIQELEVNEDSSTNAMDCGINYCKTKFLSELEVNKGIDEGLDAVILNPTHIVGPHDTRNWIQMFKLINEEKLPGIPPGQGNFCHVYDIADAHISAFENGRNGENYLLGGNVATFKEFVYTIQRGLGKKTGGMVTPPILMQIITPFYGLLSKVTGIEPDLTPEKVKMVSTIMTASSEKAKKELNFKFSSLDKIVADTIEWLKINNEL